jgi:ATP phosphoribosyltransferase regulatory subunit
MRVPRGALNPHQELSYSMEACRMKAMEVFIRHGYRPIYPPSVQRLDDLWEVLEPSKAGSIVPLTSPHGEPCALTFDVTVSAVLKLMRQEERRQRPIRICYAERAFRRPDPPEEAFEAYQTGAEIVGADGEGADCEAIYLADRALREMGMGDHLFVVGDPAMLRRALRGLPRGMGQELMGALRRRDLVAYRGILDGLGDPPKAQLLRDIPNMKGDPSLLDRVRHRFDPRELEDLDRIGEFARDSGVRIVFDLSLTRNPDYYSGPAFEIYAPDGSHLGGGGRYDGLLRRAGLLGQAVGFSLDLTALGSKAPMEVPPPRAMVWCGPLPPSKGLEFTRRLADRGITFEVSWHGRAQSSMEICAMKGIRYWIDPSGGLAIHLPTGDRLTVSRFIEENSPC